ncbi:MAG: hypothetical protein ABI824_18910 [Acidobacteriota bacterium]
MALNDLLTQARRRVITQLLLDKGALAVLVGMGGVILLLLAGTDILDWYWPVLLLVASLVYGLYQLRKHVPSLYELAQKVDARLGLADTLSTAEYFLRHPVKGLESICEMQRSVAESKAAAVDLKQAVPYQRSRYLLPAVGLLLVAVGLFAVRYAVTGSLDLRPSLIEAVNTLFATPEEKAEAALVRAKLHPQVFDPNNPDADKVDPKLQVPPDSKDGSELTKEDESKTDSADATDKDGKESEKKGDSADDSDKSGAGNDKQTDQQAKEKDSDGKDGQQSPQQSNQDQRSMLDKLKDAINNLMNQGSSDKKPGEKQQSKGQKAQDKNGDKGGEKSDKGDKGDKSQGDQQSDAAKGDPSSAQDAQKGDKSKQKGEDQANAGTDDGSKALLEAQALEAMGKLNELLGARSEQINGDMMVEVGNTKQQLKTAFTSQQSGHTEAGSEIHRDEVPLMYQQFVEKYYSEIRKGEAQPKRPAKPAAPAAMPAK